MDDVPRAKVMLAILQLSPATESMQDFSRYATTGDVKSLWRCYQNALKARKDKRESLETKGMISFEMLKPAMEAIHQIGGEPGQGA